MNLAAIDNEDERTGKKEQDKWKKEMQDMEKLKQWKLQHTIMNPKPEQVNTEPKTIQLKSKSQAK